MNRYLLLLIPIFIIIVVSQLYNVESCRGSAACFTAKVEKIIDGDTIEVDRKRIRLAFG